jgi:hypothetical protein
VTTSAAVVGLTYGGVDLQEAGFDIFLELVRGLAEQPTFRGSDSIIPGTAGRTRRSRVADVLTIELRGWVRGSGSTEALQRSDFAANRATLRALFAPSAGDQSLVATLETGQTATILAAGAGRDVWDQIVPSFATVSIELESVAPAWTIT